MNIRPVQRTDMSRLVKLMIAFARYDGSEGGINIDSEKLEEVLFSDKPELCSIVAEENGTVVAFLNYFYNYSSFELKKCIWIEDVFVEDTSRRKGLGEALFNYVKQEAKASDCARVEWLVRRNNQLGIDFYNKIGAEVDDGTIYVKWKL